MLAEGTQLGKYKVSKLLGSGGMADVYLATDIRIKRQVAIKVLPPEFARNAEHAARFKREVMASAALEHPGIVSIFDVGQSEHKSLRYQYYVMKLLPNGDLKGRIAQKLALPDVFKVCRELGSALDFAHKQGFVHRDIKPENILFDRENCAVLTDLGIARAMRTDNRMTDTGMSVGTPNYMSPEQAKGKYDLDGRADLYSLGVVLYEMLTGDVPYHADTTIGLALQHVNEPIPVLPKKVQQFQPIINLLMAKDPEDRYPTAKAFLKDLLSLEKNGKLKAAPSMPQQSNKKLRQDSSTHLPQHKSARIRKRFVLLFVVGLLVAFISLKPFFVEDLVNDSMKLVPRENKPPSVDQLEAISGAKAIARRKRERLKQKQTIQRLLVLAQQDVLAQRLTKPKGDSAYDKYREVLGLDPDNDEAKQGLNKVVESYIKLAESSMNKGDQKSALGFLETAKTITDNPTYIARLIKKVHKAKAQKVPSRARRRLNYSIGAIFSDALVAGGAGPKMIVIPAGKFVMGNKRAGGDKDEKPVHTVVVPDKFAVAQYETQFDEYDKFARMTNRAFPDDEGWGRGSRPVINVSWYDAVAYANWLSQQTGFKYRLLSEAEWEYVASAGKNTIYPWGNKPSHRYANYQTKACCDIDDRRVRRWDRTAPVGSYKANDFGLYDFSGNVWEWVMDCKTRYSSAQTRSEAIDMPNCQERVVRGGSWGSKPDALRVSNRAGRSPRKPGKYNGFRLMRKIPKPKARNNRP